MAAATIAPPIINSAQQLEPGVASASKDTQQENGLLSLLSPQYGGLYPPSNLLAEFLPPGHLPNPRPSRVLFAALRDPKLKMVHSIPLDVTIEEDTTVVVSWAAIDEFGTGETLSNAIDDFSSALRELHHRLFAPAVSLGPDLQKVKQVLEKYIQPRK